LLRFIIISIISEIVLFASIYFLGMDNSERQTIKGYASQGIHKLQMHHSFSPTEP